MTTGRCNRSPNASCRWVTAFSAASSSASVAPAGVTVTSDWLSRSMVPPSSANRCTIGVSMTSLRSGPESSASATGGAAGTAASASAPGVRQTNTCCGVICTPFLRARFTSWMATMLSPPMVKKSSSTPTAAPRISEHSAASSSAAVPGAAGTGAAGLGAAGRSAGAGSAARFSLPFTVSGRASSTTSAEGTM
jgi:hypothetical protein